jgi:hypothetical protein
VTSPLPARNYARLQLQFDARLNKILERAARDIQARVARLPLGVGGQVRQAQLRLVLAEIRNIQQVMWNQSVMDTITAGKGRAQIAAQDAMETLSNVLYASLPESVADTVRGGLRATALSGIERDVARVPRALSARVYRDFSLTSGQVEATIRSGIIQGLSARELAQSVYQYISPTTPGGASYAANRLARTEINNSFHEMQIKGGQRPGVLACVWNLSGSHGKPDECNQFASQNADGLGRGAYKPNNVPGKPHPQCLCYLTYDTMNADQFAKSLKDGKFNDDLDARINANLRRLGRGEPTRPIPGAPDTKRIDHSGHDHPKTTAARQACKKRLESVFDPLPEVPKVPKIDLPKDPHPGITSKFKRTSAFEHGGVEDAQSIVVRANGGRSRYLKGRQYQANCQQVVQAVELRKRGWDVMAKARRKDYNNFIVKDGWRYPDGKRPTIGFFLDSFDDIQKALSSYKEGERAWVSCKWKTGGAHIFNVGIEDGQIVWYDAQPANVIGRQTPDLSPPPTVQALIDRVDATDGGWNIINHTETLIVDDEVLINVEAFK